MSVARHHAEWRQLIDVSGPFLSLPVLLRAFPEGLDKAEDERDLRARLHEGYEQWLDAHASGSADPAVHRAWISFILREVLSFDTAQLADGQALPPNLSITIAEHGESIRPTLAVLDPQGRPNSKARILVQILPRVQGLESALAGGRWKASPATRMMTLLHGTGTRLGLLSNGERFMLVHAAPGETTTFATFYANLFLEEPLVLRAFRSLLGAHRLFGVPEDLTLEGLFKKSADDQQEVTTQLGLQVRRAVEVLIQNVDRIDRDRGRKLLADTDEKRLYEAAVTVMMRLVFMFAAEERGLLRLGEPLYDQHYAVSTLRAQLRETADRHGEQLLKHRYDAWARLLATFRALHAGIRHEALRLPAYGGSLFDPDRYPFLEGRPHGTTWRQTPANPLAIDNLTVLDLLESLQMLEFRVPGGGPPEKRRLSFRELDVEQIGHVYEGLLDHTARRAHAPVLSLRGAKGLEPEIEIDHLDRKLRDGGGTALISYLRDETGRSESALHKSLAYKIPGDEERRWRLACGNDDALFAQVKPWAGFIRDDVHGTPVVFEKGAIYVTEGTDRRATGTHYTPRSLTEPIVQHTLDPLVYEGPADGAPKENWRLRPARELLALRICDMAMGSGAFLVQACRYMSERLVESWEEAETAAGGRLVVTPEGDLSTGSPSERPLPRDPDERLAIARRIIADRCLYGVDKNPMAVEMAKLSLWLVTLQKDRPFTFVDHALRCGDSLLGVTDPRQITEFHISPGRGRQIPFVAKFVGPVLERARAFRQKLESFSVETLRDAEEKARLLGEAEAATADASLVADLVVGAALARAGKGESALDELYSDLAVQLALAFDEKATDERRAKVKNLLTERAVELLNERRGETHPVRRPFHWLLEFPEVLSEERGGFDAFVGNPPFQGGKLISGSVGTDYREHLVEHLAGGTKGHADLCAYFFLRAGTLLRPSGLMGLLATNTIAQGDAREVGLDQLLARGFLIPRAVRSRPWPGAASIEVAHVWVRRGTWCGGYVLDDKSAPGITTYLARTGAVAGRPYRLLANAEKSFIGCFTRGMGFVLEPEEAQRLIGHDARNRDVVFPYLNGEDLNSRPDQSPSRWVINFDDWPEKRAREYPECYAIVREKVKPERDALSDTATDRDHKVRWWQFARPRPDLRAAIEGIERVLVLSRVSQHFTVVSAKPGPVFNDRLTIIVRFPLAAIQNALHECWALTQGSTLETRPMYTPSDCFETFPFPPDTALAGLHAIGECYDDHRRKTMVASQEGLTKIYNRFHRPKEDAAVIQKLRDLHIEIDRAVVVAYGWSDLDLGHGFHETKQGVRFTISEPARREVLDRLMALNHQRYAEEVARGLHDTGKKPGRKAKTKKADDAFALTPPPSSSQVGFDFTTARKR